MFDTDNRCGHFMGLAKAANKLKPSPCYSLKEAILVNPSPMDISKGRGVSKINLITLELPIATTPGTFSHEKSSLNR